MPVTSVDIPAQLMEDALEAFGPGTTKAAAIRSSLELAVRIRRQQQGLQWLAESDPLAELRDPAVRASARR